MNHETREDKKPEVRATTGCVTNTPHVKKKLKKKSKRKIKQKNPPPYSQHRRRSYNRKKKPIANRLDPPMPSPRTNRVRTASAILNSR